MTSPDCTDADRCCEIAAQLQMKGGAEKRRESETPRHKEVKDWSRGDPDFPLDSAE